MSVIRMKKETTESIGNKNVTRGKKRKKERKMKTMIGKALNNGLRQRQTLRIVR